MTVLVIRLVVHKKSGLVKQRGDLEQLQLLVSHTVQRSEFVEKLFRENDG